MKCEICGKELEDWEDTYCEECSLNTAGSIIHTDGMFPDEDDF